MQTGLTLQQGFLLHLDYVRLYITDYDANIKHLRRSDQLCLHAHQIVLPRENFLPVIMLLFQAFLVSIHIYVLHVVDYWLYHLVL